MLILVIVIALLLAHLFKDDDCMQHFAKGHKEWDIRAGWCTVHLSSIDIKLDCIAPLL